MTDAGEKIELLKVIAHKFNEARIEWALGASMMLFLKGLVSEFHDIDLMVSDNDADRARNILSEMGRLCPPASAPKPQFRSKDFMEFRIGSVDVDVMVGFGIVKDGEFFDCSLQKDQIAELLPLGSELIPLQTPELWCKYYRLMGRNEKTDAVERALTNLKGI